MRPAVVVEVDNVSDEPSCLIKTFRPFHPIEPLLLDNTVYPLRYCIVGGFVVLGHAYGGSDGLKAFYILVAAILYTSVRVVYKSVKSGV